VAHNYSRLSPFVYTIIIFRTFTVVHRCTRARSFYSLRYRLSDCDCSYNEYSLLLFITRRPCCRREPPRDAGHLYRRLAPNPGATHLRNEYKNNNKAIGKHREVVEKPLTSVSVKDWCMSPHGITGPSDQSSQTSGNMCRFVRPLMRPNIVMLRQNVCKISVVENFFSPEK